MTGHSERAHALLSASGSKRWLTCTPSARAEDLFVSELKRQGIEEETSEFALEGTAAHEYSEILLNRELGNLTKAQATKQISKFKKTNQYYSEELEEYVQVYVDYVLERVNEAKSATSDALVLIEQRLDFSAYVPNGFGTGDVLIIGDGKLEIIDLKYGKGVPVSAHENTQMMLYGVGASDAYAFMYDIEDISMTIVQPRLDSISTYTINTDELTDWAETTVKAKAEEADRGDGEYVPGDHCRFCKIKSSCRARAEQALEVAKAEFDEEDGSITIDLPKPATLTDEELANILFVVSDIEKWCKDIQNFALEQAVSGNKIEGFKLVEGRSNRKIIDTVEAANRLLDLVDEDKIYKPQELKGISDLEKAVGKKTLTELLEGLIVKPQGKPVLVPADDPRKELQSAESAADDFAEELNG